MEKMKNIVTFNIKGETHLFSDVLIHHVEDKKLCKMITDRSKDGYIEVI